MSNLTNITLCLAKSWLDLKIEVCKICFFKHIITIRFYLNVYREKLINTSIKSMRSNKQGVDKYEIYCYLKKCKSFYFFE